MAMKRRENDYIKAVESEQERKIYIRQAWEDIQQKIDYGPTNIKKKIKWKIIWKSDIVEFNPQTYPITHAEIKTAYQKHKVCCTRQHI